LPKSSILGAACLALLLASPACAETGDKAEQSENSSDTALRSAISADWRAKDSMRDQYRHPYETIRFFQIEPGMSVIDFAPGSWYAKILIPYLGPEGRYIGVSRVYETSTSIQQVQQKAFTTIYPQQITEMLRGAGITGGARVGAINNLSDISELEGTVDRALVFRFMHNLDRRGVASAQLQQYHRLLKDDGLLGIVQHRAKEDAPDTYTDGSNGYLKQSDVIRFVEANGFELVEASEINANPKDTADHVGGVWQIPPSWASRDEAKRQIGESDRMTLLFRKRP
jgi:predicted methyltransferase